MKNMIRAACGLAVLTCAGLPATAHEAVPLAGASSTEVQAFCAQSFSSTDRDDSGFITVDEAPSASITRTRGRSPVPDATHVVISQKAGADVWMAGFDTDEDGKVRPSEYAAKCNALVNPV